MAFVKHTVAISRADLTRDCLQELRICPGYERVVDVAMIADGRDKFTAHAVDYGLANKRKADRAIRYIQREKLRHFHLKVE